MRLCLLRDERALPQQAELTLDQFYGILSKERRKGCTAETCGVGRWKHPTSKGCSEKYGSAWSPTILREDGKRGNANVLALTCLVLDLDHATDFDLLMVRMKLDADGVSYLVHSTHSHRPPADGAYRVVVPLAEPVSAEKWPAFWRWAHDRFVGRELTDESTKNLERLYFQPTTPQDVDPYFARVDGPALVAPADLPSEAPRAASSSSKPLLAQAAALGGHAEPVDLQAVRKALGRALGALRQSTKEGSEIQAQLLERYLEGQALTDDAEGRHTAFFRLAAVLARRCPETDPARALDALMALGAKSIAATPRREGDIPTDCGADEHAGDRCCYTGKLEHNLRKCLAQRADDALAVDTRKALIKAGATDALLEAASEDWEGLLLRNKEGALRSGSANVKLILANAPAMRGTIRLNVVTKSIEIVGGPLAGVSPDHLPFELTAWLEGAWDISVSSHVAEQALAAEAERNAFDPVREELEACHAEWLAEGSPPGIDTWLVDFAHAHEYGEDGEDLREYLRRVSSMSLIALVARGLSPGAQVDTVLVLETPKQGRRKSSLFRVLGGEWATGSPIEMRGKDGQMVCSRFWLAELAELDSVGRTDVSAVRAFLSQTTDDYRPPFGKSIRQAPRRCVFFGTTNDSQYLVDPAGARRFWPVRCDDAASVDLVGFREKRRLLLGEAVARYKTASRPELARGVIDAKHPQGPEGERWWFEVSEQEALADPVADTRRVDDEHGTYVGAIAEWYSRNCTSQESRRPYRADEIACSALGIERGRLTRGQLNVTGRALRKLGWRPKAMRLKAGEKLGRYWLPPDSWNATILSAVK